MCAACSGCVPTGTQPQSDLAPAEFPTAEENLAQGLVVRDVVLSWAPSASNPGGLDLLWVCPILENHNAKDIHEVWARIQVFDQRGALLEDADKQCIFVSADFSGRPIAPGSTFGPAAPYEPGSKPFLIMRELGQLTHEPVRVAVTITAAYSQPRNY